MRKWSPEFPTRSDTNQAVQPQKMARSLKFRMWIEEGLYYLCSENKGADQLRGNREADLRLCFRICKKPVFSRRGSFIVYLLYQTTTGLPVEWLRKIVLVCYRYKGERTNYRKLDEVSSGSVNMLDLGWGQVLVIKHVFCVVPGKSCINSSRMWDSLISTCILCPLKHGC